MHHIFITIPLLFLNKFAQVAAQSCSYALPNTNMQFLTVSQRLQFNLTDPCSVTCLPGYYGSLCEPIPNRTLPQGPWNQPGYYTDGPGLLKTMTIDTSGLSLIQYTSSDSALVGIFKPQLSASAIVLVSLAKRSRTTILTAPDNGLLTSMHVRYGVIYVARSLTTSLSGPHDIVSINGPLLTGPWYTLPFMKINARTYLFEVHVDKEMKTAFIYSNSDQVMACYPNNQCDTWYSNPGVTGLACGIDCPNVLYISVQTSIMRLTNTSSVQVVSSSYLINCLSSTPQLNTLVYRADTKVKQITLGSVLWSQTTQYDSLLTLSHNPVSCTYCCSLDISESLSQIILVENDIIHTVEAMQQPCGYTQTSQAVYSSDPSYCLPCPLPPVNAYPVIVCKVCSWQCAQGYSQIGSYCVAPLLSPCQQYYSLQGGVCVPSPLLFASVGSYSTGISTRATETINTLQGTEYPPYILTSGNGIAFMAMTSNLYSANKPSGDITTLVWNQMSLSSQYPRSQCCIDNSNTDYYLLSKQPNTLLAAFTLRGYPNPLKHCLWTLNTTVNATSNKGTVTQYWTLGGQLCSTAAGDNGAIYLLYCNTHYILQTSITNNAISYLAGHTSQGYADGDFYSTFFNTPTSILYYNNRLYVADTMNCLIRELDTLRNVSRTVSGILKTCERSDGTVMYPYNLTLTPYDGFFLFLEYDSTLATPVMRQFQVPYGTVSTIHTSLLSSVSAILSFTDTIVIVSKNKYYVISASTMPCPAGTMSLIGNAVSLSDCITCGSGYYSRGDHCSACTIPSCTSPGQMLQSCGGNNDAYCGMCTNKPALLSVYTGSAINDNDCPWAYLPPCPIGQYNKSGLCVDCPVWSTTATNGSSKIEQCSCVAGGRWGNNWTCIIPSPFQTLPSEVIPLIEQGSYTPPSFPFPLMYSCSYAVVDTIALVCSCQPGEYIAQIVPKICFECPSYLYSPDGVNCVRCPAYGEPSLDGSKCRCAGGTHDVALTETSIVCVCFAGNSFNNIDGCKQCNGNEYNPEALTLTDTPWSQRVICQSCNAGTFSMPGATSCTHCSFGEYRTQSMTSCAACPKGKYALDASTSLSCTDCVSTCNGLKETPCPTDSSLFICSPCDSPRPNSAFNGQSNCATSCNADFWEQDQECMPCNHFNSTTCPAGNILSPCGLYSDASCVACVNESKPGYFSEWTYVSTTDNGPSQTCNWDCSEGYKAVSLPWITQGSTLWECNKVNAWSIWNIFTI